MQEKGKNLAIVKYYDTNTEDGLIKQLQDIMSSTCMLSHESLRSIVEPLAEF